MSDWREVFRDLVAKTFREEDDALAQLAKVSERFRRLAVFSEAAEELINEGLKKLLWEHRAALHRGIRGEGKNSPEWVEKYMKMQKTDRKGASDAYEIYYQMTFAGRYLGDLKGSELLHIARCEGNRGRGLLAREDFLVSLKRLVPDEKTVRQAVKRGEVLRDLAIQAGLELESALKESA